MSSPAFPWDRLLELIEKRRLIPVVGADLVLVEEGGEPSRLATHCARTVARRLDPDGAWVSEVHSFNELVAGRAEARGRVFDLQELAWEVNNELETQIPVSQSLLDLAAIPFPLVLSTTFDPLLRRAIDTARFGGERKTRVVSYYPGDRVEDLPRRLEDLTGTTVFHLFGRLQPFPLFALTDEDVLECVLALQASSTRDDKGGLPNLFDALGRSSLLLLGTSFSDWLARFFLRIAAQTRLSGAPRFDFVTDAHLTRDEGLVLFLQHFATRTRVFLDGGPADFVSELARRWKERKPQAKPGKTDVPMHRGDVFLSYASEDREAAERLCKKLEEEGIDVWFDRKELTGGDRWEEEIRRNIEDASCFVAVLSKNSLTSSRREFRHEWSLAAAEQERTPVDLPFIIPVAVDEVSSEEPRLSLFKEPHWERAPDGDPREPLVKKLKELVRAHRAPARTLA